MSSLIRILTDSSCDFTSQDYEKLNIEYIDLKVSIHNKEYTQKELNSKDFYKLLETCKELPKTSQPSLQEFVTIFEDVKRKKETMMKNNNINKIWGDLNYMEQKVMQAIYDKGEITSEEVSKIINRGKTTAVKLLNKLIELDLIVWNGTNKFDTHGKYIIKPH